MERVPVESSNLKSIGYDPATQTLEVEFKNGSVYRYSEVPAEDHEALMAAPSVGSAFNSGIRGIFESTKVEKDEE